MPTENAKYLSDFRVKTTLGLSLTIIIMVVPFAINHFIHDRLLLGAGNVVIVFIFSVIAWSCSRNRYNPKLTLFGLVPTLILFLSLAFREMGMVGAFWCYPVVLSLYFMLPERQAWLANTAFLAIIIPQAWWVLEYPFAMRLSVTLVVVSVFSAIFVRVITDQQNKLETQAMIDPLTGLLNRTHLHDTLEHAVQQSHRLSIAVTLIALDLDHFKVINDTFGHDAGDKVLRGVGDYLHQRIRSSDMVYRLGGEEFLAILYDTNIDQGSLLAEEIRDAIESQSTIPGSTVTVSIGVATLQPGESRSEWMKRCDENLYHAKSLGRNQVVTIKQ